MFNRLIFTLAGVCPFAALLVCGCCGGKDDDFAGAVGREDGRYKILSVHGPDRNGDLLVSLEGVNQKHRTSVQLKPEAQDMIPEPGEVWEVAYQKGNTPKLQLHRRVEEKKAGTDR